MRDGLASHQVPSNWRHRVVAPSPFGNRTGEVMVSVHSPQVVSVRSPRALPPRALLSSNRQSLRIPVFAGVSRSPSAHPITPTKSHPMPWRRRLMLFFSMRGRGLRHLEPTPSTKLCSWGLAARGGVSWDIVIWRSGVRFQVDYCRTRRSPGNNQGTEMFKQK